MSESRSYGTNSNGHVTRSDTADASEHDALLPKKNEQSYDWRKYASVNVSRKRADLVLLFTYITTGLLDSAATAVWGSFVSMQTGNTIYVGLGLANPTASTRWIKSGTSILSFCAGSFIFARYHRAFSVRKRWVMITSVLVQTMFVTAAALIVTFTPSETNPAQSKEVKWHVIVPIALVAFQSAGQAVVSRALKFNALTSVVLTSIYCDLFMDAKLFAGLTENVERNQRTAAPLLLLVGAIMGGAWSRTEIGIGGALWMAVVLKLIVVVIWTIWPAEKEETD